MITPRLEVGTLFKNQNDAGKAAVKLGAIDDATPLSRIVQVRFAVAEALKHNKVVEVPKHDGRQLQRRQIVWLFAIALGEQPFGSRGAQQVTRFGSVARNATFNP